MSAVAALDLSLTSTGMAYVQNGRLVEVGNVKSKGKKTDTYDDHLQRIIAVANQVVPWVLGHDELDLVVIESPSFGSKFGNPHERSGLWWEVYKGVRQVAPIATVAPPTRAKYITGSGRSDKEVVLAHAIHYYVRDDGPTIPNHDIADAVGLAAMGARWLGEPVELHPMDKANLEAMDGAKWPILTTT